MPAADLPLLVRAALDAGPIALRFWKNAPRAWDKGGTAGPVTEADLAVNEQLEATLRAARPDYGWLSEESADDPARRRAERIFIVDPIDGTRAFIAGQDGFCHAIAVAERGRVTAAAVYLPARDLIYAASVDGPATRNGDPVRPSDTDLPGARVLTSRASLDPAMWRTDRPPPFRREFRPSIAWRLCLAAEGRFDAALSLRPCWEWDVAAASLIAARAGCVATDMNGGALRFNSAAAQVAGVVVAGPRLHGAIMGARRLAEPADPPEGEEVA